MGVQLLKCKYLGLHDARKEVARVRCDFQIRRVKADLTADEGSELARHSGVGVPSWRCLQRLHWAFG